jgi:SAM-dependent methyltransferase
MADAGIARYYDRLNRWNEVARLVGYGGGRERLTVHRALADPAADGAPTTSRLHDLLVEHLPALRAPCVLDAGCGLGGTMLMLAEKFDARVTGMTLSDSQAMTARHAFAAAGLARQLDVVVGTYDTPPAGPFDLVVALESLAHSADPGRSVAALVATLGSGARFVVVDDMPEPDAMGSPDLDAFKRGWQSPVLWSRIDYLRAFNEHGLLLERDLDLTADVRPRTLGRIRLLERLNRLAASLPFLALREVMNSHMGGLALERMLRHRMMRYRMLIARRP